MTQSSRARVQVYCHVALRRFPQGPRERTTRSGEHSPAMPACAVRFPRLRAVLSEVERTGTSGPDNLGEEVPTRLRSGKSVCHWKPVPTCHGKSVLPCHWKRSVVAGRRASGDFVPTCHKKPGCRWHVFGVWQATEGVPACWRRLCATVLLETSVVIGQRGDVFARSRGEANTDVVLPSRSGVPLRTCLTVRLETCVTVRLETVSRGRPVCHQGVVSP